jgi:23S rRNA (cytosine1962-C5)-methyltransferase
MHLSPENLQEIMQQAVQKNSRFMQILSGLQQDVDHPVHPAIRETNYLQGYIALVK